MDAALRETYEELGIHSQNIEILGQIGPPEVNLKGNMTVYPFVVRFSSYITHFILLTNVQGFVHANSDTNTENDEPLPSCDMSVLRNNLSQPEVDAIFHLPFSALASPSRLRSSTFRGNRPYWAVGVADLVSERPLEPTPILNSESELVDDSEIGVGKYGNLEVWGLTGWYVYQLMKKLQLYQMYE